MATSFVEVRAGASAGVFTIYASTSDIALETVHLLTLDVTLKDYPLATDATYPNANTPFTLTVTRPGCDCGLLVWDTPAIKTFNTGVMISPPDTFLLEKATVNEASKSASAEIVECYRDFQSCTETSTIAITDALG